MTRNDNYADKMEKKRLSQSRGSEKEAMAL